MVPLTQNSLHIGVAYDQSNVRLGVFVVLLLDFVGEQVHKILTQDCFLFIGETDLHQSKTTKDWFFYKFRRIHDNVTLSTLGEIFAGFVAQGIWEKTMMWIFFVRHLQHCLRMKNSLKLMINPLVRCH